jgi:hypothetical protein
VIPAGSLEREIAERLQGAGGLAAAMEEAGQNAAALEALRRHAVDNLFGPGDHRGSVQHGERLAEATRGPAKLDDVLRLQSDLATAWWHVWMGMLGGKR